MVALKDCSQRYTTNIQTHIPQTPKVGTVCMRNYVHTQTHIHKHVLTPTATSI